MVLDTRIPLMGRTPDVFGALQRGYEAQDQRRLAPVLQRLKEEEATQAEQITRKDDRAAYMQKVQIQGRIAKSLLTIEDMSERRDVIRQVAPDLIDAGMITREEAEGMIGDTSTSTLQRVVEMGSALQPGVAKPVGVPAIGEQGEQTGFFQQVQDPDGSFRSVFTPHGGDLTDRLGRDRGARVEEAGATAGATEGAKLDERLEKEPQIASKVASARALSEGMAQRGNERISLGLDAALGLPTLRRSLELLRLVKTGGIHAYRLRIKQRFGIENADEAELANSLGKAVLSQLRATFGSQFTEKEGALLADIEAGISKSTEGNIKLLENLKKIALQNANNAIEEAVAAKDFGTAGQIQDFLDMDLGANDGGSSERVRYDASGNRI